MSIWHDMSPKRVNPSDFIAVVETSKGSKRKYELNKETGLIIPDRILYTSTHYPINCGFIPKTYDDDRDLLDVLVLYSESLESYTLVRCFPIGVISTLDSNRNDEKVIAIPFNDPTYNQYQDISKLPTHIFDEMFHSFRVYREFEDKETAAKEVNGHEEAVRIIETALDSYVENPCR